MKHFLIICIFIFSSFLTLQELEGGETRNEFEITETGPNTFQVAFTFNDAKITTNFKTIKYGDNFIFTKTEVQTLKFTTLNKTFISDPSYTKYNEDHILYSFYYKNIPIYDHGTYVDLKYFPATNTFEMSYETERYSYSSYWD